MTTTAEPRLLILGAHPDDAEFHAGGLAARYRRLGRAVKLVSVTNGAAGHHRLEPDELARRRRDEAAAAGRVIGAEYVTWDFPDGALLPSLELRHQIIREIRSFEPDLVLTHRTCDYHPDHRAVGQAVQDASYLVTVPLVVRDVPILRRDPVVAAMADLFTRPNPLRPDVVLDTTAEVDSIVAMLACHESQVFDFLPYNQGLLEQVPSDPAQRLAWLRAWYGGRARAVADRFRSSLVAELGEEVGGAVEFAEAYEISEYATALDPAERKRLFPD
ncbi:MAG: PIG-L family deacetylase [Pirellulaceae bacterium]|nr:PIG-L family deacetylase [Pirellulaceae bacterium]